MALDWGLCRFQTALGLAHEGGGALQLHRQHFLQLGKLVGEFVAVNLHHAGGEYAGLRFAQCRLELVDDVIHRGEFLVALDRGRVVVRGFSQVGSFRS